MQTLIALLGVIGLSGITFALVAQRRAASRDARHKRGIATHLRHYR